MSDCTKVVDNRHVTEWLRTWRIDTSNKCTHLMQKPHVLTCCSVKQNDGVSLGWLNLWKSLPMNYV